MQRAQITGKSFAFASGQILTENYGATIKKLAFPGENRFVQLVPARVVAGQKHLETALEHALSSFKNGTNFARKPELEFIVRLLAEKQLEKALKKAEFADEPLVLVLELKGAAKAKNLKAGKGKSPSAVKEINEIEKRLNFREKTFSLGKNKNYLMELFNVSETELKTLKDLKNPLEELIIERVALVALER